MVSYFLNNAAKTWLYGLTLSEKIEFEHVFQSKALFHLTSNLHRNCCSGFKVRSEVVALKQNIKNLEWDKFKSSYQYVLQNDKLCNHYTGFPINIILEAVFEYLDPGKNGENVVLYNSQKAKEEEAWGQKRMITTIQFLY